MNLSKGGMLHCYIFCQEIAKVVGHPTNIVHYSTGSLYRKPGLHGSRDTLVLTILTKTKLELSKRSLEEVLFGPEMGEITNTFVKYLESSTSAPTPQLNISPWGNDFEKSSLSSLSQFADDGLTPGTLQHQFYSAYLKKNDLSPTEHLEMKNKYLELTSLTSNYRKLEQKHNSWVKKLKRLRQQADKL